MEVVHTLLTRDTMVEEVALTEGVLTIKETEAGAEEVKATMHSSSVGPGMSEAGTVMLKVIISV
jgi:hypothetical protein